MAAQRPGQLWGTGLYLAPAAASQPAFSAACDDDAHGQCDGRCVMAQLTTYDADPAARGTASPLLRQSNHLERNGWYLCAPHTNHSDGRPRSNLRTGPRINPECRRCHHRYGQLGNVTGTQPDGRTEPGGRVECAFDPASDWHSPRAHAPASIAPGREDSPTRWHSAKPMLPTWPGIRCRSSRSISIRFCSERAWPSYVPQSGWERQRSSIPCSAYRSRAVSRRAASTPSSGPWSVGARCAFSTDLSGRQSASAVGGVSPDETFVSAEIPIHYRTSRHLIVEFGGRYTERAPYLGEPGFAWHYREMWLFLNLTASSIPSSTRS